MIVKEIFLLPSLDSCSIQKENEGEGYIEMKNLSQKIPLLSMLAPAHYVWSIYLMDM